MPIVSLLMLAYAKYRVEPVLNQAPGRFRNRRYSMATSQYYTSKEEPRQG